MHSFHSGAGYALFLGFLAVLILDLIFISPKVIRAAKSALILAETQEKRREIVRSVIYSSAMLFLLAIPVWLYSRVS